MDSRASLVDLVFAKCSLVYGRDFLGRWEGLDINEVKADWQRELAGLGADMIKYGLQRLPKDRPPTVLQFREVCLGAPGMQNEYVPRLPAPKVADDPVAKARITEMMKQTRIRVIGRRA